MVVGLVLFIAHVYWGAVVIWLVTWFWFGLAVQRRLARERLRLGDGPLTVRYPKSFVSIFRITALLAGVLVLVGVVLLIIGHFV